MSKEKLDQLVQSFTIDKIEEKEYNNTTFLRYYNSVHQIVPTIDANEWSLNRLRTRIKKHHQAKKSKPVESPQQPKRAKIVIDPILEPITPRDIAEIVEVVIRQMNKHNYSPAEINSKSGSFKDADIKELFQLLIEKCSLQVDYYFVVTGAEDHPMLGEKLWYYSPDHCFFFKDSEVQLMPILNAFTEVFFQCPTHNKKKPGRLWAEAIKSQYALLQYYA